MQFKLPFGGITDQLSQEWEKKTASQQAHCLMQHGPTGVVGTGATSTCGATNEPFELMGEQSHKVFALPTGSTLCATEKKNSCTTYKTQHKMSTLCLE